jgi:MFS family permease
MPANLRQRWNAWRRAPWAPAVPLLVAQLVSGIWYMPQVAFFPIYLEEQLGYAPLAISSLVSASQIAGSLAGVVGGVLSDALGSKWVLILGLASAALASLVFVTGAPALVAVLWILSGLGVGFHTLGGSSYLTKVADRRYLGVLSAFYELNLTLGGALGNPAAGVILEARGFGAFGIALFGLTVATLVGSALFVPRLAELHIRGSSPSSAGGEWRRTWAGALGLVGRPAVAMLLALRFLPTVCYGMMGVLIPLLIHRIAGHKTTVALYGTASLVAASTAQLVAGRAADRFGRRWPTLLSFATLIAAAIGLGLFSQRLWGVIAFGVLANSAAWALSALMFCLVADGVPKEEHGRVLGLLHGIWSLGMVAGAMLGGGLITVAPGLPFLVAALLNVGSLFILLAFLARVRVKPHSGPAPG